MVDTIVPESEIDHNDGKRGRSWEEYPSGMRLKLTSQYVLVPIKTIETRKG